MANQVLTPVVLTPDAVPTDLSASLATATQTTVQFANTGNVLLLVNPGAATTTTVTVNVGAQVLGQAVSSFTPYTMTVANHVYAFGPFHSALDAPGALTVTVTFSSISTTSVSLVQLPGVY